MGHDTFWCHTPESVAHFLWICPQYHAQREILLANLRKIGVNVNTADVLRNPEASCHVQRFVDATNHVQRYVDANPLNRFTSSKTWR